MYRITLKNVLPAALLLAGANAYAADNEVTLASGETTTWASVVAALNGGTDSEALALRVQNAANAVKNFQGDSIETTTAEWLVNLQAQSKNFASIYDDVVNDETYVPKQPTIYFKIAKGRGTNATKTLYFSFVEVDDTYTAALPAAFYEAVDTDVNGTDATKVTSLRIFLGQTDGANNYSENNGFLVEPVDGVDPNTIGDVINTAIQSKTLTEQFQTEGFTAAYKAVKEAYESALKAQQDATSNKVAYKTINLNGNVTPTETIGEFDGTINGNGYSFTAPLDGVFTTFTGKLNNAAVNGVFAENTEVTDGENTTKASFSNVAMWDGKKGTWYTSAGTASSEDYTNLGKLAFDTRSRFGVEGGKLVKVSDTNKVYSIQVYDKETAGATTYVTYAGDVFTNLSNNRPVTVGDNVFVKSETDDLEVANVFYENNGTMYAHSVEITDGVDFFCPEDIDAAVVTYTRNFGTGLNSLFLPFKFSVSNLNGQKDAEISYYTAVKDDQFVFQKVNTSINAYTPVLVDAKGSTITSVSANNCIVEATDKQLVKSGDAYGLLAATSSATINEENPNAVFGLTSKGTFQYAAAGNDFAAFRMVIAYSFPETQTAPTVSRGITFLEPMDEDMTGIESVDNDANGFAVAGGAGVISINSAADCGNVAVYSVDGRVAANAYVTAGTTTVEVPAGLYIVNGQKVIVK